MNQILRLFLAFLLFSASTHVVGTAHCFGQDIRALAEEKFGKESRVWFAEPGDTSLDRWNPRKLFEDFGTVLEWNQKEVVLLRPNATNPTTIPGDYLVRIEPSWTNEKGSQVHQAYCDHQFKTVLAEGRNATSSGLPQWQQRLILAEMIESASVLGKHSDAGLLFASLAKYQPPQLLLATVPIPWGDEVLGADSLKLQGSAEKWISDDLEGLQLMGASWLLTGGKRKQAIETLESLARNSKVPLIAVYAKAQLWRTLPPAEIASDRYARCLAERDSLPLPFQAGPTMLLAERLQQSGQSQMAIAEWLRIATLHPDRYHLAKKAVTKAVAALKTLQRDDEAAQIEKAWGKP